MKTILITGARSGIAKGVIERIKNDYYIYATTHTESEAESLREIYKDYENIECFKLDITSKVDRDIVRELDIDILLCNAAVSYGGSLVEIDVNRVRDNYEVNVFSNLELIQSVLKKMIENGKGKIIIMSSLAGIIPFGFIGSYCSTKASLIKIAEVLRKELKLVNKNINVCLIEPGLYLTGFNRYMFMNKYNNDTLYFKNKIKTINFREFLILKLIGKRKLTSIVNKIVDSIESKNGFIFRAPFVQVMGAKIYSLFKE